MICRTVRANQEFPALTSCHVTSKNSFYVIPPSRTFENPYFQLGEGGGPPPSKSARRGQDARPRQRRGPECVDYVIDDVI